MLQNNHNYLQTYDTTVAELASSPDSLVLRHRAVLSLARVGALDFAWAEYGRYGFGDVSAHADKKLLEDIMALKGRLLKDMALRAVLDGDSDQCAVLARRSAAAYARAFAATGGYYSGINVAAMSLLGGRLERTVADKASAVLDVLPNEKAQNKEDTYYIEATRAEALLLMGHKNKAGEILHGALMHDPLNYTAHATTFKQFRMVMDARGESTEWLEPFAPPCAVHFAGHIFSSEPGIENHLAPETQEDLYAEICEQIQRHDIGFGYGALAAGADILIAEALLEEGAELHIILPVPVDQFIATSVTPFGADWDLRFDQCLSMVTSLTICSNKNSQWPDKTSARYASQIAMGRAVMRAETLFTHARQLLIWNEKDKASATTADAHTWREASLDNVPNSGQAYARKQIVIPYPGKRVSSRNPSDSSPSSLPDNQAQNLVALIYVDLKPLQTEDSAQITCAGESIEKIAQSENPVLHMPTDTGVLIGYERAGNAACCARKILADLSKQYPAMDFPIAGHYLPINNLQSPHEDLARTVQNISAAIVPGEFYVSETFAAVLAVFNTAEFSVEYAGMRNFGGGHTEMRLFHIA